MGAELWAIMAAWTWAEWAVLAVCVAASAAVAKGIPRG